MTFRDVDTKASFPALEQEVQRWWDEAGVAQRSLESGDRARPYAFFEGPPTANGRPGIHHVEARASKDIIIRYRRMCGQYVVGARGGWDTHGLPVEIEVEKQLGFSGKPDIETYGIAKFNQACRESVWKYIQEWELLTNRMAYWIDLKHPYVTYHNEYIESLWWILRTFSERGLLDRDYKVTMHCPRCGTSLSDHEVSQGFQDDVEDPSVWLRFKVRPSGHDLDERLAGSSFIAWTTTPWTLPANVALAVNPEASYVLAEFAGDEAPAERVILAADLATAVLGEGKYTVLATFEGASLKEVRYARLFDGVPAPGEEFRQEQGYYVVADPFVSLEDGTGIVHIAPAYGDLEIGRKFQLPTLFSVDLSGLTLPEFAHLGFGGVFFKQADPLIMRDLRQRGLLFRSGRVRHSYPFCWRCTTPLLYYAKPSWYIRTTLRKNALVANNEQIDWVPDHIKQGRFGNWLENNIDWAISRERYWGTPLPIWICDACARTEVLGSVAELSERAGRDLSDLDLHRPYVDEVAWKCAVCAGGTMRRVPDVADCWFDSGSMPVAQWHYPFENEELFRISGQAEYISEAIDQTRGWFYTLHAVSTLLFDRPAFRHVVCLGHLLDAKGQKMSKSRGNVVDPMQVMEEYGADAVRWYMYASAPPYNPRRFSPALVAEVVRQFLLTLWNTYGFFVTYSNLDGWEPRHGSDGTRVTDALAVPAEIDRWAIARLNALVRDVTRMLDEYDLYGPAKAIEGFVDELSNWYVRRNRRRFWRSGGDADKLAAYGTLYTCLTTLSQLLAPFAPFISEAIYRNLVGERNPGAPESVHLASWPVADEALIDEKLLGDTALLLEAVGLGRSARQTAALRVRQPLSQMLIWTTRNVEGLRKFEPELREELNIKSIRFMHPSEHLVEHRFKPNLPVVGRKHGKHVPLLKKGLQGLSGDAAAAAADAVHASQGFDLVVDGERFRLEPEDVLLEVVSPEGYAVAEGNGLLVALDTHMTPELEMEGQARDLVRFVQDARKAAGFGITDRVRITLEPRDQLDLAPLLRLFEDYVQSETLADSVVVGAPEDGAHTTEAELGGATAVIGVKRAPDPV